MSNSIIQELIDEYDPNIVTLDVYNVYKGEETQGTFKFLFDNQELIHDFRVEWKKVCIQLTTTASHFEGKNVKKSWFLFRDKILNELGLPHYSSNNHEKTHKILNIEEIKKLSNIFNEHLKTERLTLKSINYILFGSNSSGEEGSPKKAQFKIFYKNQKYAFASFIQSLILPLEESELFFDKIKDINIHRYSFNDWIVNRSPEFIDNFEWFNIEGHSIDQWKNKLKRWIGRNNRQRRIKQDLDALVRRKRQELERNISDRNTFYTNFWEKQHSGNQIQLAHIYPVYMSRKKCFSIGRERWAIHLNEISDKNNVMPLPAQLHINYDDKKIYWKLNGELQKINSWIITEEWIILMLQEHRKIPINSLNSYRQYYINEYVKTFKNNELLAYSNFFN